MATDSQVYRLPPELVRKIGDQLVGTKQFNVSRAPGDFRVDFIGLGTLPSLATASRFFLEPTLDALWDTLPDYGILVYALPRDAWAVETGHFSKWPIFINGNNFEGEPSVQYVSITRALTEDEIKRIQYYTPRVKRIRELSALFPGRFRGRRVIYESSVLTSFASCWTPETPIFPNLRVLDVSPADDQYPVYYRFFHVLFGPQLRRISSDITIFPNMTKTVPDDDYQQMLVRLHESAPHLSHLQLNADIHPYSPTIILAISTTICNFKYLVSVRTGRLPITAQAFRHLGMLPRLDIIDVRLPDIIPEASFRRAPFGEIFPSLRELRLSHSGNLNLISLVVQHTRSPQLEIIGAELIDIAFHPLDDVMFFFSTVVSRNNPEGIKELTITQAIIERTPQSDFSRQHLEPLFALRSLTTLKLHLWCTYTLDDAILGRAARAWPNMQVLELGPGSIWRDAQVPSLAALVPFAQHCPELQVLAINLDADLSRIPPGLRDSSPGIRCAQQKLIALKVGRARISDPRGVAVFLNDLFPYLRSIQHGNHGVYLALGSDENEVQWSMEWDHCWNKVCGDYLPTMARERGLVYEQTLDDIDAQVPMVRYIGLWTRE